MVILISLHEEAMLQTVKPTDSSLFMESLQTPVLKRGRSANYTSE